MARTLSPVLNINVNSSTIAASMFSNVTFSGSLSNFIRLNTAVGSSATTGGSFTTFPPAISALQSAANGLAIGSSVVFATSNDGQTLFDTFGGATSNSLLEWGNKGFYDQTAGLVYVCGSAHNGGSPSSWKFVALTESTNTWSVLTPPQSSTDPEHIADGFAGNGTTGVCYARLFNGKRVRIWSGGLTGTWSDTPIIPYGGTQNYNAVNYFPDRNSIVTMDADWGLWEFPLPSGTWKEWAQGNGSDGSNLFRINNIDTSGIGYIYNVYDPATKSLLIGGANNLWSFSATGVLTAKASAPAAFRVGAGDAPDRAICFMNPVDNLMTVVVESGAMYKYNPTANTWATVTNTCPFTLGGYENVIPIPKYGVVMLCRYNTPNIYLWKP